MQQWEHPKHDRPFHAVYIYRKHRYFVTQVHGLSRRFHLDSLETFVSWKFRDNPDVMMVVAWEYDTRSDGRIYYRVPQHTAVT